MTRWRVAGWQTDWAYPSLVLAAGLLMTLWVALATRASIQQDAQLRFDRLAERLGIVAGTRMLQPQYGLRGAAGVYAASDAVSREDFRSYVASRDLATEFPGALGFGFIERVPRSDLDAFIARERADAAPDFTVRTSGNADDLLVIKYIEPLVGSSRVDLQACKLEYSIVSPK